MYNRWAPYVPVAKRRRRAQAEMKKLRKKGRTLLPVQIEGRTIAREFWGRAWCDHLEKFSDFANRLPRGRTYVRNGSVCDLAIRPGRVEAIVSGSELYKLDIRITPLPEPAWGRIKRRCAGGIGSLLELLQGRFSDSVMAVVTDRDDGLLPRPEEIHFSCSCPDWAVMCKHVAAAMYGVGARLDEYPSLLFRLRRVDHEELIAAPVEVQAVTRSGSAAPRLDSAELADVFGLDLVADVRSAQPAESPPADPGKQTVSGRGAGVRKRAAKHRAKPSAKRRQSTVGGANRPRRRASAPKAVAGSGPVRIRPTGKSVARLRKRLQLTVAEFGKELGVSEATVRRWESVPGRLNLQRRTLLALAQAGRPDAQLRRSETASPQRRAAARGKAVRPLAE